MKLRAWFAGAVALVFLITPSVSSATTLSELEALVRSLQAQIAALQGGSSSSSSSSCISLTRNLYFGLSDAATGGEVSKLQKFLGGQVTGYFGPMTEQLVQRWQAAHGIVSSGSADSTGYGAVGPTTRAALARGCTTTTTTSTTTNQVVTEEAAIEITSKSSSTIYGTYSNLPENSQIWIVRSSTGKRYTAQSTFIENGGSGSVTIPIPSDLAKGTYRLQASDYYDSSNIYAKSSTFSAVGSNVVVKPTCSLTASPSAVAPNIPTVLSWSSTNATSASWTDDSSGKDNIDPPSGTPATSGSLVFTPNINIGPGQSATPSVTLKVVGSGGSATCTAYVTVMHSVQAQFSDLTFTQAHTSTPTISGTASGVSQVGVVLSLDGGKAYGSGLIPVTNGYWSVVVSPPLDPGSYFVIVYDDDNNEILNGGYLVVD